MEDDIRVIYQQDCESFRYEDKLFWSRFQTLSVIEGAAIGVILTETIKGWPAVVLALGTLVIVGLISILAIQNRRDAENFINRISKYEANEEVDRITPKSLLGINSFSFTVTISVLLTLLNIYLILFTLKFSSYYSLLILKAVVAN